MSELFEGLNEAQREAVRTTDGPLLVLAGAGSGKTRVITRRAAYLARTVTQPRHVLAITFTNKAAGEMKERISALGFGREMTVCTFHSLCARLLRWFAREAELSSDFTILDESDRRQIVKRGIEESGLSSGNWSPATVQAKISHAKNQLLTAQDFAQQARSGDFVEQSLARIYSCYQRLLTEQQAVDFDDLLLKTALLLGRHPEIRARLEDQFRYVLIDEYQDTNRTQYMIARGLTLTNENICATGDPDQSIYAWRGANIRNILEFEHDFPSAKVVRLEQNYRSTQRILAAADSLIRTNKQRKPKRLWTENEAGPRVRVVEREDAEDEAEYLVEEIRKHREAGGALGDIAIFYRVNSLTRVIEEAFLRGGISYQIARGTEFYNRKEIKDLLAYLRVLVNPADELALTRAINTPARGIGKATVERLALQARQLGIPIFEAVRRCGEIPELRRAGARIQNFVRLLDGLRARTDQPVDVLVREVLTTSGLEVELRKESGYSEEAIDNVEELISAAADFMQVNPEGRLPEWLQQISLVSDVDAVESGIGAVTLMTLHAAKGLEFPKVFIIAVEDGLLPHANYKEDPVQLEEERRLCFVGMTRARQELTLSYARWRVLRGMSARSSQSQFLTELPQDEIEWLGGPGEQPLRDRPDVLRPARGEYDSWKKGMYLRHPSFGVGQLMWKQADGKHTRAGLRFTRYGEKTLILEYAKMRPLDADECQL